MSPIPQTDLQGSILQDVIRVLNRADSSPLYTINLYRTTSSAMINGPTHSHFMTHDFRLVSEQIDQMDIPLNERNAMMKRILTSNERFPIPTQKHKQKAKKTRHSESPRKLYPARRRRSSNNATTSRRRLSNQPTIIEAGVPYDDDSTTDSDLELTIVEVEPEEEPAAVIEETDDVHVMSEVVEEKSNKDPAAVIQEAKETNDVHITSEIVEEKSNENPSPTNYETEGQAGTEDQTEKAEAESETRHPSPNTSSEKHARDNRSERPRSCRPHNLPLRYVDAKEDTTTTTETDPMEFEKTSDVTPPSKLNKKQEVPLYCICKSQWEDGIRYIGCDNCDGWFHPSCVGVTKNMIQTTNFICPPCSSQNSLSQDSKKSTDKNTTSETENANVQPKNLNNKESQDEISKETKKQANLDRKSTKMDDEIVVKLKQEISDAEKKNAKLSSSLEIINKRCALLEREKVLSENTTTKQQLTIKEQAQAIENLEQIKVDLQKEIAVHTKINEDLIAAQTSTTTPNETPNTAALKEKKEEINSLKQKVVNLETIVKEKEKDLLSIQTEFFSCKKEKERLSRIIDTYMNRDETRPTIEEPVTTREPLSTLSLLPSAAISNDTNDHMVASPKYDRRKSIKCWYELKQKNHCHRREQCHYNHEIADEERQTNSSNINDNYCEVAFRNKQNTCPDFQNNQCNKKHSFNLMRLKRGICIKELKQKGSCKFDNKCHFSHEIPSGCRNDAALIQQAENSISASKNKNRPTSRRADQWTKRGPCLYEFFKKNSCPHGIRCRFNHEISTNMMADPTITNGVLETINKSSNKDKIISILGQNVVNDAAQLNSGKAQNLIRNAERLRTSRPTNNQINQLSSNYLPQHNLYQQKYVAPPAIDTAQPHPTIPSYQFQTTPNQQFTLPAWQKNVAPPASDTSQTHPSYQLQTAPNQQFTLPAWQNQHFLSHVSKEMINKDHFPLISVV